ncbi:hypothetical protein ACH5RR_030481 [Cinchona calisaya]|uniref:RNase H type-1 domain-containing protein n=1 Tax=Cinchona calisaya TaxID=153742 RepID=A0ABD2YY81_9GENT
MKIWAERRESSNDPTLIEEKAIRTSLILAKDSGWDKVEIMPSNKEIVNKLRNKSTENVKLATLLEDIIYLSALFSGSSFSWKHEDSISKVVRLATFAVTLTSRLVRRIIFHIWLY